tara:strand:+ start:1321 stop:2220 length:900 start_codon:yes stop_codon:yes gene_type:complete
MPSNDQYKGVDNAKENISVEEIQPSTLETIDFALFDFINDKMNSSADTNEGWKKTPVIWVTSERAFLSKNNKDLRDEDGSLRLPLITIERTSVVKDLNFKGAYYSNPVNYSDSFRGGRIVLARKIVKDKTNNFSVADNIKSLNGIKRTPKGQAYYPVKKNEKVVYETLNIPMPVYLTINYTVTVRTQYIQQMNQLTTPFATLGGHINSFAIRKDGHKYETFVQSDFALNNNVSSMGTDERTYDTKFTFKVLGYIIGEGPNGDRPKVIKRENAVEVKIPRERVILGDIPERNDNKGFYRE